MNMDDKNVVEQMIGYLSTPMAKHKGVSISPEDCEIWVDEFRLFLTKYHSGPNDFYAWLLNQANMAHMSGKDGACETLLEVIGEYRKDLSFKL